MVIAISGEGHAEIDIAVIWFFENNILITSRFRLSDRWMDGQPINSRKSLPFFLSLPTSLFIIIWLSEAYFCEMLARGHCPRRRVCVDWLPVELMTRRG